MWGPIVYARTVEAGSCVGSGGSVCLTYGVSNVLLRLTIVGTIGGTLVIRMGCTIGFGIVRSVGFSGLDRARSVKNQPGYLPYKARTTINNV